MFLPKFDFHEATSVAEVTELMAAYGRAARPLAGGTDLIVNMKKKNLAPKHLIYLGRIDALQSTFSENGMLIIGAGCTVAELADSDVIKTKASALANGAKSLGSPLVRNLATIGGNIGSARPAADLPPALIAYGASAVLQSISGERIIAIEELLTGPGMTAMQADEIISAISVPIAGSNQGAGYIQLGIRRAQDCNLVNVASFLSLNEDGTIGSARIVMGSVGPTPLRAASAEKILIGEKPGNALFEKAKDAAAADSRPILDFRGSAEYRRDMAGVLTRRTLETAWQEIQDRS
jgi:carbon-monoxide dehydrogenase medium subunit